MCNEAVKNVDPEREVELRAMVEEKVSRMREERAEAERQEREREARYQRQFALDMATKVVVEVLRGSGRLDDVLARADQYTRWLETGQLPS